MVEVNRSWLTLFLCTSLAACSAASEDDHVGSTSSDTGVGGGGGFGSSSSQAGSTSASGNGGSGGAGGMAPDCEVSGVPGSCIDVADCLGSFVPVPGHCPGPTNIQCCIPSGEATCDPNAAPLPNAGLIEEPGLGGCPSGMLAVDTFCIDRFEASLVYVADDTSFSPFHNPGTASVRAVSIQGAVPQGYIDGLQAESACQASGKRLCTDDEWLRACQGPNDDTYPYGDTDMLGVCNDHRAVHPAVELYGTTDSWIYSHLDNACLNQLPMSLDKTGSNPGCVTAEGAFDMMGNLHEWTADPAGTFRGGYYVDTKLNGPGCLYVTTAHDTAHWDYSTGFRCCAD